MAQCPVCGYALNLREGAEVGERVECAECGELLEVISLKPLELDYAFDVEEWEEEDWEEEDWDEDWEKAEA